MKGRHTSMNEEQQQRPATATATATATGSELQGTPAADAAHHHQQQQQQAPGRNGDGGGEGPYTSPSPPPSPPARPRPHPRPRAAASADADAEGVSASPKAPTPTSVSAPTPTAKQAHPQQGGRLRYKSSSLANLTRRGGGRGGGPKQQQQPEQGGIMGLMGMGAAQQGGAVVVQLGGTTPPAAAPPAPPIIGKPSWPPASAATSAPSLGSELGPGVRLRRERSQGSAVPPRMPLPQEKITRRRSASLDMMDMTRLMDSSDIPSFLSKKINKGDSVETEASAPATKQTTATAEEKASAPQRIFIMKGRPREDSPVRTCSLPWRRSMIQTSAPGRLSRESSGIQISREVQIATNAPLSDEDDVDVSTGSVSSDETLAAGVTSEPGDEFSESDDEINVDGELKPLPVLFETREIRIAPHSTRIQSTSHPKEVPQILPPILSASLCSIPSNPTTGQIEKPQASIQQPCTPPRDLQHCVEPLPTVDQTHEQLQTPIPSPDFSPPKGNSRWPCKGFYAEYKRVEATRGHEQASNYANCTLSELSGRTQCLAYVDFADCLKREGKFQQAATFFFTALNKYPTDSRIWLEFAKMQEEIGNLSFARTLLYSGLEWCGASENLLIKAIKLETKLDNLNHGRSLISKISSTIEQDSISKWWRTILEGAMLEAKAGFHNIAVMVFNYLMEHNPTGPAIQAYYLYEEKRGCYSNAKKIAEQGVNITPKYGPLWFSLLRIKERLKEPIDQIRSVIACASSMLSQDLLWKWYFEAAQLEEHEGDMALCRSHYAMSAWNCPDITLWKVWLGGARTELAAQNTVTSRMLVERAIACAPVKMKASILIDRARIDEFIGDVNSARQQLVDCRITQKQEWKVFLESVLLELRYGNCDCAYKLVQEAIQVHPSTGRLWAIFMQLKFALEPCTAEQKIELFFNALTAVPKSGEVLCEGGRIFIQQKNYPIADRLLRYAIHFTPQYGDSFIELVRKDILETGGSNLELIKNLCANSDPNYGPFWSYCKKGHLDSPAAVLQYATSIVKSNLHDTNVNPMYQLPKNATVFERRKLIFGSEQIKP
ncbi:pre-mRNA splicing factor [Pelomyxa schiedti]|nr:pre-mRNA splicing factor [Pelomyxa schiedti]